MREHDDYVAERWGMVKQRANQFIDAARVVANIREETATIVAVPDTESQARPLAVLEPEGRREAWKRAVENSEGKPTARHVRAAVDEVISEGAPSTRRRSPTGIGDDDGGSDRPALLRPYVPVATGGERLAELIFKGLDAIDGMTWAVSDQIELGGYGGLPAVHEYLGPDGVRRFRGKVEILIGRLRSWIEPIPPRRTTERRDEKPPARRMSDGGAGGPGVRDRARRGEIMDENLRRPARAATPR